MKKVLEDHGYAVFSVDWDPKWKPDLVINVLRWKYKEWFQPGDFDIVAASPPCTEYSAAMTTRPRRLKDADRVVRQTRKIIEYLQPRLWWIENPRHGKLQERAVVQDLKYIDLDYCMFEQWGYHKPTRFWVPRSMANKEDVLCRGNCPNMVEDDEGHRRHRVQIGGRSGQRARKEQAYRIPRGIIEYLCGFRGPPLSYQPSNEEGQQESPVEEDSLLREVMVRPWQHRPERPFCIGQMKSRGSAHQLMLKVVVRAGNGRRMLNVLVDTCAHTRLIRRASSRMNASARPGGRCC